MIFWEGYKVLDLIFVPEFEIYLVLFRFPPTHLKWRGVISWSGFNVITSNGANDATLFKFVDYCSYSIVVKSNLFILS